MVHLHVKSRLGGLHTQLQHFRASAFYRQQQPVIIMTLNYLQNQTAKKQAFLNYSACASDFYILPTLVPIWQNNLPKSPQ